jgi:GDP-L-fucose synthase
VLKMKVFVAGHRGMVGSSLVRRLSPEHDVLVVERSELNLTNKLQVKNFLESNHIDAVVMAAAKVGGIFENSTKQIQFLVENLEIQNALLMAAHEAEVENFIFLGSSCMYPKFTTQPMLESQLLEGAPEPTNAGYSLAKNAGTFLCSQIGKTTGRNYLTLVPCNLYGPNDNFDLLSSHVPAALMRKAHEAKIQNADSITVWGTGKAFREFMHVDDLAESCSYFLSKPVPGEVINIGTGEELTIREFASVMCDVVGFGGQIVFDDSKPDGMSRKIMDSTKAGLYGWSKKIGLKEGLTFTYEWFQNNSSIRGMNK